MSANVSVEPVDFPESAQAALLDSFPMAVLVTDAALRMLFINQAAEKLLGYERGEVLGGHVGTLIPLAEVNRRSDLFPLRALPHAAPAAENARTCLLNSRHGAPFPAEILSFAVRCGGNRYFGVLIRDLTEDRMREQEQQKTRRLADLGKAISLIAHEIRKRLTLIGGFARQLAGSRLVSDQASAATKLKIIVDEVGALERMLNGIRLIGRLPEPSSRRVLNLNELIRETLQLLHPLFDKLPIQVSTELCPEPLSVLADPDLLKQVLLNLLHNAFDSLSGKGWIQIRSEPRTDTTVAVAIDDSGPGIPKDLAERIFEPFFTTKTGGTGLGLAICKNIIEDHGGRIFFLPGVPRGTTFVIELPLQASLANIP